MPKVDTQFVFAGLAVALLLTISGFSLFTIAFILGLFLLAAMHAFMWRTDLYIGTFDDVTNADVDTDFWGQAPANTITLNESQLNRKIYLVDNVASVATDITPPVTIVLPDPDTVSLYDYYEIEASAQTVLTARQLFTLYSLGMEDPTGQTNGSFNNLYASIEYFSGSGPNLIGRNKIKVVALDLQLMGIVRRWVAFGGFTNN
jgi:hypothetical protein